MKEETILRIYSDENGVYQYECENPEELIMAGAAIIQDDFVHGNNESLNQLLAVVVHLCARFNDKFQEEFIKNLRKFTLEYRDRYIKMAKDLAKAKS